MKAFLWVGLGGAMGSMLRFALQYFFNVGAFPWGTLGVNLAGCLLMGLFWGLADRGSMPDSGRQLLMSGFCGGFTTLSAFSQESNALLQQQRNLSFFLYAAGTFLGGLLATFAGYKAIPS
ncbi:fluoride efflux transporter FluC [Flaviaesturariibacter aridisoli]|uniref:Fluoride-specific ion channel FluC n=1 Tax=Flaviaesturariibacter aridisoli TaxID=2545761 RepID=A0A4R4DZ06_9BACT|nr:CrcB family protein [Flaviaesturariibacter aridisoli]TCZ67345.1 CrcB family protein [Flaviaesturariibacter aridisoli]